MDKDGLQKLREECGVGCSDHGCVFGHPGGMGTNGGCHCLMNAIPHVSDRVRIRKFIIGLRRAIAAREIDAAGGAK